MFSIDEAREREREPRDVGRKCKRKREPRDLGRKCERDALGRATSGAGAKRVTAGTARWRRKGARTRR